MISTVKNNPLQPSTSGIKFSKRKWFSSSLRMRPSMAEATSSLTYRKFVEFALEETRKHTHLAPSTLQVRNTLLLELTIIITRGAYDFVLRVKRICCFMSKVFFLGFVDIWRKSHLSLVLSRVSGVVCSFCTFFKRLWPTFWHVVYALQEIPMSNMCLVQFTYLCLRFKIWGLLIMKMLFLVEYCLGFWGSTRICWKLRMILLFLTL